MAARKMFSSLSRPAKDILLQRSPNCSNPLRFRFSPTATRPFSAKSESDHLSHWATEYRRRLGIDDAPVILCPIIDRYWRPPRDGQIKIKFAVLFRHHDDSDEDDYKHAWDEDDEEQIHAGSGEDDDKHTGDEDEQEQIHADSGEDDDKHAGDEDYQEQFPKIAHIAAVARNSSGDPLGATVCCKPHKSEDPLEVQIYAMKAAGILAEELRSTGIHDGPVVYETYHPQAVRYFHVDRDLVCADEIHDEGFWRGLPGDEDLEDVGQLCYTVCGSYRGIKWDLPSSFEHVVDGF